MSRGTTCAACGHELVFHQIGTGHGVPVGQAYCDDRHAEPCSCQGFQRGSVTRYASSLFLARQLEAFRQHEFSLWYTYLGPSRFSEYAPQSERSPGMTIVIYYRHANDPRPHRCVMQAGQFKREVRETDALGGESWRPESTPLTNERVLALALEQTLTSPVRGDGNTAHQYTIDLDRIAK